MSRAAQTEDVPVDNGEMPVTARPTAPAAMLAVVATAAAMVGEAAAAIECHAPGERQNGLRCPISLDSFQYESRISLELLQKALFPFASGETRQYR
ncbi:MULTISPECIES: hypothetical protein [unclassified Bradyrhizobium]|uniref:hypothetical protein n=1 Tax=unclassified Bradyrhizobium TaxID=2631580 RepID=UPI0024796F82|nr:MULTISPECIES: hypothetical protein [unclassified Bradyrhizobium]WGS22183.1 hypothetical protein MTX22_11160 [Bradyrhizobium sp. ISRA463]WGS29149.1 hypothetical protein MTX19_08945 [Bradyrhizobium sp. ISRA464]